jgi:hypothetical protein
MTTEQPPAPGLTRTNTGYPHDVYRGWFLTPEAVALIEERVANAPTGLQDPFAGVGTRKPARLSPVPMEARPAPKKAAPKPATPGFNPVVCGYCGRIFMSRATGKPRSYCSNSCRAKGNHRKARGVLPIRSGERKAS